MTYQEMTKHIRGRVKQAGIKARVRHISSCGRDLIQVITPTYESKFTADEIYKIAFIADCNRLTWNRGSKIDPTLLSQLTRANEFTFEYNKS